MNGKESGDDVFKLGEFDGLDEVIRDANIEALLLLALILVAGASHNLLIELLCGTKLRDKLECLVPVDFGHGKIEKDQVETISCS